MQEHLSELIFITAIAGLNLKITFVMIGGPNKQFNFKKKILRLIDLNILLTFLKNAFC